MTTKTICGCGHPISEHTYSEDFTGCDQENCNCTLDMGAHIDNLNALVTDAKARAKTAEENWHKNEARIAKLEAHIKIYANENNWKSINGFMVLQTLSAPWSDAQAALKGAE